MFILYHISIKIYSHLTHNIQDNLTIFPYDRIKNNTVVSRWYSDHLSWLQDNQLIVLPDKCCRANLKSGNICSLVQDMDVVVRRDSEH